VRTPSRALTTVAAGVLTLDAALLAVAGVALDRWPLLVGGGVCAVLALLVALEPVGVASRLLRPLAALALPAWVVWLVVIATSLWRSDAVTGTGPRLTWRTGAWAATLWVLLTVPALLG